MGRETGEAEVGKHNAGASSSHALDLSRYVMDHQASEAQSKTFDPLAPAPSSAGQRMWDVTKQGVLEIPAGFVNSLDTSNILPNVGMGLAIGAATKIVLAEGGPVAKVAGGLMTAYFLGKPVVETYGQALSAQNMGEMHSAAKVFGNAVGGLPVSMAEGAIGAKIGSGLAGKLLATEAAAPFVEWKANQYAKLDARFENGVIAARNVAANRFGIGNAITPADGVSGVVPPYMLEELAARNPSNPDFANTIKRTQEVKLRSHVASAEEGGARNVYDAKGQESTGVKVRSEGQPKTGVPEVDASYDYTGDVRSLYKDVYQRNSIDNKGMSLESTVNYGDNYENAFWDGSRMTYGKPGPQSPFKTFVLRDVTGHEMTHGVTQYEANLVYRGQPGALNESISDVFGALVEQRAKGQTAAEASWLVGDGIWKPEVKGRALRDMLKPGTAYDDPAIGKDPQPAHMKDFVTTGRDNGGVHLNSGIPNKAFATFAQDVGGNAWDAPGQIWYKARANAGSHPSFAQFAYQTIEAAKQLGYTSETVKLQNAWQGVGVKPSLTDSGAPKAFLTPIITNNGLDKKAAG